MIRIIKNKQTIQTQNHNILLQDKYYSVSFINDRIMSSHFLQYEKESETLHSYSETPSTQQNSKSITSFSEALIYAKSNPVVFGWRYFISYRRRRRCKHRISNIEKTIRDIAAKIILRYASNAHQVKG